MASNTPKNLYYTVPLDDGDLESLDYYLQEKKSPWFSIPVRSAEVATTPSRSPLSALKEKLLLSWPNDNDDHHISNTRSDDSGHGHGGRGFWDRWIWLVHAVLLTISMTLFALSMCTLQTAASTSAVQCQGTTMTESTDPSNFVPRSFLDEEQTAAPAPAVVLPVPIVVPESKHVDMEVSVDDRTSVEDVD